MCAGDAETSAALSRFDAADHCGSEARWSVVARWLDDGVAPSGACGRKFSGRANHEFDHEKKAFLRPEVGVVAARVGHRGGGFQGGGEP